MTNTVKSENGLTAVHFNLEDAIKLKDTLTDVVSVDMGNLQLFEGLTAQCDMITIILPPFGDCVIIQRSSN